MLIKTLHVGPFETNCYIVTDEASLDCAVIDPGADGSAILNYLEDNKLHCRCVLLTHGHFDHVGALEVVLDETGAELYMSEKDNGVVIGGEPYALRVPPTAHFIAEGDEIAVGALRFRVMETPGHTPGSVCYICEDAIFCGDTLFRGSCGRTDFPLSSTEAIMHSLRRLYELEGDYEVYPGHMSSTTLSRERSANMFMRTAVSRES